MKKIKVYVAGPYRGEISKNTHNAIKIGGLLLSYGFVPFVPHLTHFWGIITPKEDEDWINYGLEWLKVCDCILVLPGFENSEGTKIEIEMAKGLNIPIFYHIDEIRIYYGSKLNE